MKERMKMKGEVQVSVRKFVKNPTGKVVLKDGTRGYYKAPTMVKIQNLVTTAGIDFLFQQGYGDSGLDTNGGNYIALSTDATSPAAGDTSVTGEISSGGLSRAQGTYAHTAGQSTATITKTFTATGTHTDVRKTGLLTASSGGTLVHEASFNPVDLVANDQVTVTWSITLS